MTTTKRFWFGYLAAKDVHKSSVVVYDKLLNKRLGGQVVLLFNLKRNGILPYGKEAIRPKLRNLVKDELVLINVALDCYFPARAAWSSNLDESDSEEIRDIRQQIAREEREAFLAHARDRSKTEEDWANEYLASDDPDIRETGRMMVAQIRVDRDPHGSQITTVMYDSLEDVPSVSGTRGIGKTGPGR